MQDSPPSPLQTGTDGRLNAPDPSTVQAARLAKSDLYIRARIGSEHAEVLVLTLTAKTLAAVAEAACSEDPSLSPPVAVRFKGASLTSDGQLAHCLPKVDMDADQALVLISKHLRVPPASTDPPAASEQSKPSDTRFARPAPASTTETAIAPHQVMLSYNWGVQTATGKYDMQELVKCIAAELKRSNLSVWMDVDLGIDSGPLMNGDILDKMADAVNQCQVFVAVVTPQYQVSPNCKHEFKYAATLQKSIVPVYAADGNELHADAIHMVTSPLIQARFGRIFAHCRTSLDFTSHADWDSQIAVLKREILAKLNATAASVTRATAPASIPTVPVSSSDYYYLKRQLEDWLNPVSFESDMAAYASQYVPRTRVWAVGAIGRQFEGDANVVWLNGAAGVGKSLVAYLAASSPPAGFTLLSAFFCKHYDEKKNNAKQLVCRLVYDLACVSPAACREVHLLMQKDKEYCKINSNALSILDKPIVAFSSLFLELLPLLGSSNDLQSVSDSSISSVPPQAPAARYLIVIDALDECGIQGDPTRKELLSLLASLNTTTSSTAAKLPPFVKILTTGRPEADIWNVMESLRTDSLVPTAAANVRDIQLFVQHEVAHFPYSLGPQTDECCRLLTEKSEFVFVAARVLCSQLRTIVDNNHGVKGLDTVALVRSLSASLDDQYARILDSNIKKNDATDLDVYMKFMYVLLAAKAPLDCANIAILTDLTPAGVQLVISKLHSLLLVSAEGKVTVLHKSVKDFLISLARCTVSEVTAFHVSLVEANMFVAQRCLAVLNSKLHHNMFGLLSVSEPVQPKQQELLSTLSPAVRYSCLHWSTHFLDAAKLDSREIQHMLSATQSALSNFCTTKILQWLEVLAVEKQLGQLIETCTNLVKMMDSVSDVQKNATHHITKQENILAGALSNSEHSNHSHTPSEVSSHEIARNLFYDVARLAGRFHPALDFNPLHVYQSALTFTPHDTKLYQLYHSFAGGKVTASPDLTWGPLVSSMSGHTGEVTSVAYNPDGSLIASGSYDCTVRVWNPLSGALVSELKGHSSTVRSVAFNHDSSLIASGSGSSGSYDCTVRVWNPLSGALVSELKGHSSTVRSVAFNHDSSLIASGSGSSGSYDCT
ncbi:POC1 centriolar protein A, partial [Entophlyctis luteolus]